MEVSVENTGGLARRMTVQVPAERVDQEVSSRLKSMSQTVRLDGFRPGKVPVKVLEKRYGQQVRLEVIDQVVNAMLKEERLALFEGQKSKEEAEKKAWGVDTKEEQKGHKNFKAVKARMKRASDLGSPAPPGHFLREFGQSDRELVENASDEASITQALALLNGPALGAVMNRYSVLSRSLEGKSMTEKLDIIYLTLLSRAPTKRERQIFEQSWEANPESRYAKDIVWTMLNTRQFLFIQ